MKKYKSSYYNHVIKDGNDSIVFNARNCALVKVNNIFMELLNHPNERNDSSYETLAQQMYNAGFLVDETADEIKILEHAYNDARNSKEKLTLTILPSYDCNFKCFYCFEDKKAISLTPKEVVAIKKFTDSHAIGIKELDVCWFGGEPLLNPDPIWDLSDYFIKLAEESGFQYKAIMISNGSLVDDEIVKKLKSAKISLLQITVDGDRTTHDKRRGFINGGGSFDVIMNNIQKLTSNSIKVNCRINLDKTNYSGVVKLIHYLKERNFKNFQVSFGHLLPLGGDDSWASKVGYSMDEFSKVTDKLAKVLDEAGVSKANDYPFYPKPIKNFCGACQVNSFVIHPNGDLYRCYDNLDYKIGNVFTGLHNDDVEKRNDAHWMKHNPFKDEECTFCKVLPLCMGGCPLLKSLQHKKFCLKWKTDLEDALINKYYSSKK